MDTVSTIVSLVGIGVALMVGGIAQTDWKHKGLIYGLIGLGGLIVVLGLTFPWLQNLAPRAATLVADIATTPAVWFATVILAIAANLTLSRALPAAIARLRGKPASSPSDQATTAAVVTLSDQQTRQDVLHLLDLGVYQTTLTMLSHLVDQIPGKYDADAIAPFPDDHANEKARHDADAYLDSVRRLICDGSDRAGRYQGVWNRAEHDAESLLRKIPQEHRPQDVDPLLLREYAIAYRRAVYTAQFLRSERAEIERVVIQHRATMIERFQRRNEK